jgi:hypothetical protein
MDEARNENREKIEKLKKLDELAVEVDKITADGKVTDKEILVLRRKLEALEDLSRKQ